MELEFPGLISICKHSHFSLKRADTTSINLVLRTVGSVCEHWYIGMSWAGGKESLWIIYGGSLKDGHMYKDFIDTSCLEVAFSTVL